MIRTLYYKTINILKENYEITSRPEQIQKAKSALKDELKHWGKKQIDTEINSVF